MAGESDVAYYYANHNQPTSIQTHLSTFVNPSFDALGRMTLETTQTGQRGLVYDLAGRATSVRTGSARRS